ncbi:MAG: tetratricopeptide repeat protein, partial [Geobacter sp.]
MYLVAASVLTLCGIFSKETAFGFFIGAVFILAAEHEKKHNILYDKRSVSPIILVCYTALAFLTALFYNNFYIVLLLGLLFWIHLVINTNKTQDTKHYTKHFVSSVSVLLSVILIVTLFFAFRKTAFVSDTSKIVNTLKAMTSDPNYTLELYFGAAGFYVKKFFLPTPLNLAIREIDPLYELFGVICFMACIAFIYLRRLYSSLVIAGFMMLAPAFLLVLGTFAWTAYAERYCYIPSAFWILAGICYIDSKADVHKHFIKIARLTFYFFAIYFTVSSLQRNLQWRTNIDIIKDTVKKTPDFKNVRGLYMSALVEKKDFAEAERQYHAAKKINTIAYDERYDIMYATILISQKRYSEAEKIYKEVEAKTNGRSIELYETMIAYYDSKIFESKNGPEASNYKTK